MQKHILISSYIVIIGILKNAVSQPLNFPLIVQRCQLKFSSVSSTLSDLVRSHSAWFGLIRLQAIELSIADKNWGGICGHLSLRHVGSLAVLLICSPVVTCTLFNPVGRRGWDLQSRPESRIGLKWKFKMTSWVVGGPDQFRWFRQPKAVALVADINCVCVWSWVCLGRSVGRSVSLDARSCTDSMDFQQSDAGCVYLESGGWTMLCPK